MLLPLLDLSFQFGATLLGWGAGVPLCLLLAGAAQAAPAPVQPPSAKVRTSLGADVLAVGRRFLGRPYVAGSLDPGGRERLVCRTDAFDCVTFVENSLAIALARRGPESLGYPGQLERLRYRRGKRDGYISRLHYFSEWIQDNAERGLVRDCSAALGGVPDPRPLHFMTRHREAYPALRHDATFRALRQVERQLNQRPRHYIPRERVPQILDRLEDGDILAITTTVDGLDVSHVGLACRQPNGDVHLLHASSAGQAVELSSGPLLAFLREREGRSGIMVARPI